MSPELHAQLFGASGQDADYIGVAVPPEDLAEAFELAKPSSPASTAPFRTKRRVIELLDEVDTAARDLHSVNTVAFRTARRPATTRISSALPSRSYATVYRCAAKKCLLLGYGGAASVMAYHCVTRARTSPSPAAISKRPPRCRSRSPRLCRARAFPCSAAATSRAISRSCSIPRRSACIRRKIARRCTICRTRPSMCSTRSTIRQ